MKRLIFSFVVLFIAMLVNVQAQKATLELSFSSVLGSMPVSSNSYTVTNLTQGGDTILFYPDTILVLNYVGVHDNISVNANSFSISGSFPNPVKEHSTFEVFVPNADKVSMIAINSMGKQMASFEKQMNTGRHLISFSPGNDCFYMIVVRWQGISRSIKIIGTNTSSLGKCSLSYESSLGNSSELKTGSVANSIGYNYGDELLIEGYFEGFVSQLRDIPTTNKTYQLQFGKYIPCPGTPTVSYMGKVYNVVQVYNQCWMKENLDAGIVVNGIFDQTDNEVIEKYCYENDPVNCEIYGGLYQWDELMAYNSDDEQGICPDGWHVPLDADWKILEGAMDSDYGVANEIWDQEDWRGSDAGGNLKDTGTQLWFSPNTGATNESGFTAIPGGFRNFTGNGFQGKGYGTIFWSSISFDYFSSWVRNLNNEHADVGRSIETKTYGFSVRCLKNEDN